MLPLEGEDDVEYVTVARVGEIPDGEGRAFDVRGIPVGVFSCGSHYFAVSDICTHAHALLHEGSLDAVRFTVECPLHGSEFDLRTGEVLTPPAAEAIARYQVRVQGDQIQVALIPPGSEK